MWTRTELKNRAKGEMSRRYGWMLLAVLLMFVLVLAAVVLTVNLALLVSPAYSLSPGTFVPYWSDLPPLSEEGIPEGSAGDFMRSYLYTVAYKLGMSVVKYALLFMAVVLAVWYGFKTFVLDIVYVGVCRFLWEARRNNKADPRHLLWAFRRERYMKMVVTMFLYNLAIFLGTLLFVIPGRVLFYRYYYVPYILAEFPDLAGLAALRLSKAMSDREKGRIFALNVSFLGWKLLALFTCGMSGFLLKPYIWAVNTELYAAKRQRPTFI